MVEEYDAKTNLLLSINNCQRKFSADSYLFSLVRKWKQKPASGLKTVSTSDLWIFEIGQNYEVKPIAENTLGMAESTSTVCKYRLSLIK